jgi:hypothetical protein
MLLARTLGSELSRSLSRLDRPLPVGPVSAVAVAAE